MNYIRLASSSVAVAVATLLVGCKDSSTQLPTAPTAVSPPAASFSQTATAASRAQGGLSDASDRLLALVESANVRADLRNHIAALDAAIAAGNVRKADDALDKAEKALDKVAAYGLVVETPEIASIRLALVAARLALNQPGS